MNKQRIIELKAQAYDLVNKGHGITVSANESMEKGRALALKKMLTGGLTPEEENELAGIKTSLEGINEQLAAFRNQLDELDKQIAEEEAKS